jgi:antirestriction protein ArdC
VLQNEMRFIFSAASHAQRAADYPHGSQGVSLATAIEPEAAAVSSLSAMQHRRGMLA